MSLENIGYQYSPIHTKSFSLGHDWPRKPHVLPGLLKSSIKNGLDQLQNDGDIIARFVFRAPQDTHVLPLFQNEQFSQLVQLHNTESKNHAFVHPLTLMMFDPQLANLNLAHKKPFHNIRGEDAIQHELRHFLRLQELWKADAKGVIEFNLHWQETKDMMTLVGGGTFTTDEIPNNDDRMYTLGAPLYPSKFDLEELNETLLDARGFQKLRNRAAIDRFRIQKMKEQSVKSSFAYLNHEPLNTQEAFGLLYYEWKKLRKDIIDFTLWDSLIKSKKL